MSRCMNEVWARRGMAADRSGLEVELGVVSQKVSCSFAWSQLAKRECCATPSWALGARGTGFCQPSVSQTDGLSEPAIQGLRGLLGRTKDGQGRPDVDEMLSQTGAKAAV